VGLGHSNELNVGHVSSGHFRRLSNLISHAVEVCFDIDHSFQSEHSSRAYDPVMCVQNSFGSKASIRGRDGVKLGQAQSVFDSELPWHAQNPR